MPTFTPPPNIYADIKVAQMESVIRTGSTSTSTLGPNAPPPNIVVDAAAVRAALAAGAFRNPEIFKPNPKFQTLFQWKLGNLTFSRRIEIGDPSAPQAQDMPVPLLPGQEEVTGNRPPVRRGVNIVNGFSLSNSGRGFRPNVIGPVAKVFRYFRPN